MPGSKPTKTGEAEPAEKATGKKPANTASTQPRPPREVLFLKDKEGMEQQVEVPKGFWDMERQGLEIFIKKMWPDTEWAGNGQPDMFGISISFH
jgi:hypothetical protein